MFSKSKSIPIAGNIAVAIHFALQGNSPNKLFVCGEPNEIKSRPTSLVNWLLKSTRLKKIALKKVDPKWQIRYMYEGETRFNYATLMYVQLTREQPEQFWFWKVSVTDVYVLARMQKHNGTMETVLIAEHEYRKIVTRK